MKEEFLVSEEAVKGHVWGGESVKMHFLGSGEAVIGHFLGRGGCERAYLGRAGCERAFFWGREAVKEYF